MKRFNLYHLMFAFSFLFTLTFTNIALASEISDKAKQVFQRIDAMDVEHKWQVGNHVNWETGAPTGVPEKKPGTHTHCSAFAAAVAKNLGIYILRPPEHSTVLLANAQSDWLKSSNATKDGWKQLDSKTLAQDSANQGNFVVAVYKSHKDNKPGHIAIVRPSNKSSAEISDEGPQITQAGMKNYVSTSAKQGFSGHKWAFAKDEIQYFQHSVSNP